MYIYCSHRYNNVLIEWAGKCIKVNKLWQELLLNNLRLDVIITLNLSLFPTLY